MPEQCYMHITFIHKYFSNDHCSLEVIIPASYMLIISSECRMDCSSNPIDLPNLSLNMLKSEAKTFSSPPGGWLQHRL